MHDTLMSGRATNATPSHRPAGQLEVRWVPVTDARGRSHLEACWITVGGEQKAVAAA